MPASHLFIVAVKVGILFAKLNYNIYIADIQETK